MTEDAKLLTETALKLADQGKFEDALLTLDHAIALSPEPCALWIRKAHIQIFGLSQFNQSLDSLTEALGIDQTNAEIYYLMGYVSLNMNQFDDAIELFTLGLQFNPLHADMRSFSGMAHLYKRDFVMARTEVFMALDQNPSSTYTLLNAFNIAELLPLTESEQTSLTAAIEKNKTNPKLKDSILLFEAKKMFSEKNINAAIETLGQIASQNPDTTAAKEFLLGDCERRQGHHDKAFDHYKNANKAQSLSGEARPLKRDTLQELAQRTIASLPALGPKLDVAERVDPAYPSPVFLIGFPRSGTTLTGRILDTHSKFFTADEVAAIDQIKILVEQELGLTLPENLAALSPEQIKILQDIYAVKQSNRPTQHPDKIFIDKMPFNTFHVPLIRMIFPKAKFLYAIRHPLDAVLSSFMQYFALNSGTIHCLNLDTAAELYKTHHNLWNAAKRHLPIDYHEFRYENLVNDFDGTIGGILDFLGADREDNVREFYKQKSAEPTTLTPSRTQITGQLTSEPQDRWKKYEGYLDSTKNTLGEIIEELGYIVKPI